MLYYHARYYDPNLGRFLSADSVVPGSPSGTMQGVALKPLTVDFHESGFVSGIAKENHQAFWFQMDHQQRQKANAPWGPANAQALNRYSYVQNNPLKYTDPTGHTVYLTHDQAQKFVWFLQDLSKDFNLMSTLLSAFEAGGFAAAWLALEKGSASLAGLLAATGTAGAILFGLVIGAIAAGGVLAAYQMDKLATWIDRLNGSQGVALQYGYWCAACLTDRMAVMNRETGETWWVGFPIYYEPFIPKEYWWDQGDHGDDPTNGNCRLDSLTGKPIVSGGRCV